MCKASIYIVMSAIWWYIQHPSAKLVTHCTSESIELGFFLIIMIFFSVVLIDGMIPIFHAFLDDNAHLTSINGARYLSLLQNTVWSKLWYTATRYFLWWMQDCTPTHCTNAVLAFIDENCRGWVLSRAEEQRTRGQRTVRTSTSSISIFGWLRKIRIFKEKPNSIDSLVQWVESFTERLHPRDNQES